MPKRLTYEQLEQRIEKLQKVEHELKQVQADLRINEERYCMAQAISHVGNWEYNIQTAQFWGSPEAKRIYGLDPEQLDLSTDVIENCIPERERVHQALVDLIEEGKPYNLEFEIHPKDSSKPRIISSVAELKRDEHGQLIIVGVIQNITERKRVEDALRESEQNFRNLADSGRALIWTSGADKLCNYFNRVWLEFTGRNLDQELGNGWAEGVHPDDLQRCLDIYIGAFDRHEKFSMEYRLRRFDGEYRWILDDGCPRYDSKGEFVGYIGHCLDITERKRSESEREKLHVQLSQAQKMESVGRLAGGVAHDFNNMLSIILGHSEMAMDNLDPAHPIIPDLEEIHKAASHSADLTRQLLAFARKQTIAPKVLDLNETVEGMLKMLRRIVGENIDLAWLPKSDVWPVRMDPTQIDQILANLCVNARDAIKDVGKITIETGKAIFDEAYCKDHAEVIPGEYALLSVSDDGFGMSQETLKNIFEPFFTTKEIGKGTGLGLATVYGIVNQNNGFINVYSQPGMGTTFKIYLSRYEEKAKQIFKIDQATTAVGGKETILLVEDEPAILKMTTMMLERLGYHVLGAHSPGEAIRTAREYAGEIHLLMTDVVMPEMNGRDLAKNLFSHYPNLKCLFMSGYTANVIAHHGVLDEGVNFLEKPFSRQNLAAMIQKALFE